MIDESGWLIEYNGECIGIECGEVAWVPYTYDNALRFARKADAENMLEYLTKNMIRIPAGTFVSEHGWS